jgi:ABC-type transport system involved in multi-copper enzyme maturation permease subunit
MNWLFWKEYRQNRVVVIALLLMLVVPHLFGLYAMWDEWHEAKIHGHTWQQVLQAWKVVLTGASLYSLGISQVALALIGGNAIAGERADCSAEFQAYLPLTRQKILAAKLLLALAIAAVVWLINPLIIVSNSLPSAGGELAHAPSFMMNAAITGLVFFCVAWFFSSTLRSPTFSFAAGLAAPVIILSLILFGGLLFRSDHWKAGTEPIAQICYVSVSLAVALPNFGLGTWLFLRRVEP